MQITHHRFVRLLQVTAVLAAVMGGFWFLNQSTHLAAKAGKDATEEVPQFRFDPSYPKQLPNHWILGAIGALWVDSKDHVWIAQRPGSVKNPGDLFGFQGLSECCTPAPPV